MMCRSRSVRLRSRPRIGFRALKPPLFSRRGRFVNLRAARTAFINIFHCGTVQTAAACRAVTFPVVTASIVFGARSVCQRKRSSRDSSFIVCFVLEEVKGNYQLISETQRGNWHVLRATIWALPPTFFWPYLLFDPKQPLSGWWFVLVTKRPGLSKLKWKRKTKNEERKRTQWTGLWLVGCLAANAKGNMREHARVSVDPCGLITASHSLAFYIYIYILYSICVLFSKKQPNNNESESKEEKLAAVQSYRWRWL